MRQYALYDHVTDDVWMVDGTAVVTSSLDKIAMFWMNFEREEPGRYTIISADV